MASKNQIDVGGVLIGGGAPVAVQTMTKTETADLEATLAQIRRVAEAGADLVRCAVPRDQDAEALKTIVRESPIPVIADIHFNHTLALKALDAGAHCIRLNPGNIGGPDKVAEVVAKAQSLGTPLRIGVDSGSLPAHLRELEYSDPVEALVTAAVEFVELMERLDFTNFIISGRRSAIPVTSRLTRPVPMTSAGGLGRRFYIICEAQESFRAISAGHGGGRDLGGLADFANGRRCVKNFGNAMDSDLTTGGAYVTGETTASFKGYYRAAGEGDEVFTRPFLKFDGEGETANARERAIGGHPAVLLQGSVPPKRSGEPARRPGRLRSVRKARELRGWAQRRLHQLVGLGRRGHHGDGEGTIRPRSTSIRSPATSRLSRGRFRPERRRRARGSIGTPRA